MDNVITDEASPAPRAQAIIEQFLACADEEIRHLDEIRKDGGLSTAGSSLRRFELRDTVQALHQLLKECPPAPVPGKQGSTPTRQEPGISGCREKIAAAIATALTEAGKDPILRDAITAVGMSAQTALLSLQETPSYPGERKRYLSLALAMCFMVICSFAVSYGVDRVNQQLHELAKTKIACEASVNSNLEKEAEKAGIQQCAEEAQVQSGNCAKAEQFKQACGNLEKIKTACNADDAQAACAAATSTDSSCTSATKNKPLCLRLAKASDDCGKSWRFNAECENATKANQLCRTTVKAQMLFEARAATSSSASPEDKCASVLLFGLAPESAGISVILKSISLVFNILFVTGLIGLIFSFLRLFGITLADSIIEALMNGIHDAGKSGGGKPDSSSALSSVFSLKGLVGTAMAATIGVAGVNTYQQQTSISKETVNKEYINKELRSNVDRSVEKYVKESVLQSGDEQKVLAGKLGEIADALKKLSEAQKAQSGPSPGGASHSVSIVFPKTQDKSDENAEDRLEEKLRNSLTLKLDNAMCRENHKMRCRLSDQQQQLRVLCKQVEDAEGQLINNVHKLRQHVVYAGSLEEINMGKKIDCTEILKKIVECEEACVK